MDTEEATIYFGAFELNMESYRLTRDGHEVSMEPQVFDVLSYLVENRDRVVPKTDLLDNIWGDRFVSESALSSRIKSARRAVGDDGRSQAVIRTYHGRGYQFVAEVETELDVAEPGLPHRSDGVRQPRRSSDALIGREDELDALWSLIGESPIVTIVGPGGVGKTRLATELARMWESAGDQSVFVPLEPLSEPDRLASEIVDALGVRVDAEIDPVSALDNALQGAPAPLIVLDNFEHITDAAPEVARFVSEIPSLRVLVTSRERLRLSGEHTFELSPLSLQDRDGGSAASSLFEHAARRVKSDFSVTSENAESIAAICRLVDGLPLAIELAAAQLRYVPVEYLLTHLKTNVVAIGEELADRPARQRSVTDLIQWSYALLTPSQQRLLARLSVFSGGWSIAGTRAVGALDSDAAALAGLQALIDKSLVRSESRSGVPRFTMLNLIRHFADAQISDGEERADVERAHTAFVVATVREIEEARWGSRADEWREAVAVEYANISRALERAAEAGDAETLGSIAGDLNMWWYRTGRHIEGRRWSEAAMAVLDQLDDTARGRVLFGAGYIAMGDGRLEDAGGHYRAAIEASDRAGDWRYAQFARASLSGTELDAPDRFDESLARVDDVIAEAGKRGEIAVLAHALNVSGVLLQYNGRFGPSKQRLIDAVAANKQSGDRFQQTMNLGNLGILLIAEGEGKEALIYLRDALHLAWRIGSHLMSARLIAEIARAHQIMGELDLSARLLGTAESVIARLGARSRGPTAMPKAHEETVAALQIGLGPERFQECTDEGRQATLEAAVELALTLDS